MSKHNDTVLTKQYFDTFVERLTDMLNARFDAINERFDAQDKRLDEHDKRFDAIDKRFDALTTTVEGMREQVAANSVQLTNIAQSAAYEPALLRDKQQSQKSKKGRIK